jgi:hypothetical protein
MEQLRRIAVAVGRGRHFRQLEALRRLIAIVVVAHSRRRAISSMPDFMNSCDKAELFGGCAGAAGGSAVPAVAARLASAGNVRAMPGPLKLTEPLQMLARADTSTNNRPFWSITSAVPLCPLTVTFRCCCFVCPKVAALSTAAQTRRRMLRESRFIRPRPLSNQTVILTN